jgi:hypothetical protein
VAFSAQMWMNGRAIPALTSPRVKPPISLARRPQQQAKRTIARFICTLGRRVARFFSAVRTSASSQRERNCEASTFQRGVSVHVRSPVADASADETEAS